MADESTISRNVVKARAILYLPAYTVVQLASLVGEHPDGGFGVVIVSNEAGGRTLATFDGTNWRRVSDGAICT